MNPKYLGLISIVFLLAGLWFVICKWSQGNHMTFSQHVAQHKSATIYYFFLFAITLPLLNVFFIKWFTPTFDLPVWFNIFAVAASVFQIACTLVPELPGLRTKLHQLLAGISALLLLPLPMILASSPHIEAAGRIVAALSLLTMIGVIVFTIRFKGRHAKLLIAQITYFIAFFIPVLLIGYF